ncbi:glycosyltransferase family 4 protein [uncultured Acetatifactor sp.]|uniref:glycosyltransferase family 4 protein n=1 Tax=uncultured Acetatifactor sp. TaxID=1671927 RepID=UPI002601B33A|nr:glycosyltransferase family 4 protein [uncultured Acetatifactor sp.]
MKVLWLCNMVLPAAARELGMEASVKEGWVSGMAGAVLAGCHESGIRLSVAFPLPGHMIGPGQEFRAGTVDAETGGAGERASFSYYGFPEDVGHAEKYDGRLEHVLEKIVSIAEPDIVHCFGTEFPHTLAMCRAFPRKDRLLLGLQGLCTPIAEHYYADLPERTVRRATLRDRLKRDSLRRQREKFVLRGVMEREAVGLAGNITGRTRWDRMYAREWNPRARYFEMNESLRPEFYGPVWDPEACEPHSIFLSQGDYPLKGLHYMLRALRIILAVYPEAKLYVAGNSLVAYGTWKEKLKISGYGRFLREMLTGLGLEGRVCFLGKLDAGQMRDRYLKCGLFVCCSAVENSPNSLGEAMLLGVPCVSADVGGISSIFTGGVDGILYRGADHGGASGGPGTEGAGELGAVSGRLAEAVLEMWRDSRKRDEYCRNARKHALKTHDRDRNYQKLVEIYEEIL